MILYYNSRYLFQKVLLPYLCHFQDFILTDTSYFIKKIGGSMFQISYCLLCTIQDDIAHYTPSQKGYSPKFSFFCCFSVLLLVGELSRVQVKLQYCERCSWFIEGFVQEQELLVISQSRYVYTYIVSLLFHFASDPRRRKQLQKGSILFVTDNGDHHQAQLIIYHDISWFSLRKCFTPRIGLTQDHICAKHVLGISLSTF
eukprot:TRINITY_DN16236_c0_g1_i3.p3 TRINITY_DN16236_c0_g1~~TRINITY_DN16236_c0_g1_i3.p3  ORF type:complete len:200 (-),score=-14.16 TRINITY_DN16236_c0_g1_i3:416-1015(-)